jgi:hypothetical protein
MSSDLDTIDYSSLHAEIAPTKKQTGITTRKFENKPAQAAPVDSASVVERAGQMQQEMGAPVPASGITNYGLEILGTLGALGAAYQAFKGKDQQPKGPVAPTAQDAITQMKLERERLKTEKAQIQHENFVRENTLTPVEQALGRKAKDPTELGILKKLYDQEVSAGRMEPYEGYVAPKTPITPTAVTPAPTAAPVVPPPVVEAPVAQAPVAPIVEPAIAETPAAKQIAASTPTTPQAVVEAVKNKEPVVAADKPISKAKKPVDPSEAGLTKQEIGMKRYLESFYGGGEVGAKTYNQVGEILGYRPAFDPGKGGGLKPEENLKIKGYRKENIEGPKVNLDKDMKRALKGGAGAAALMAIPGFADAAQRKDYGRMADLASDFVVPPFAGSTELGISTLGEKQLKAFENAQKLGSPYRSVPPR